MRYFLKLDAFAAISGMKISKTSRGFPPDPVGFARPSCPPLPPPQHFAQLGVNTKSTTDSAVRTELGRFPLHITIFSTVLKYLFHLLNDHNETLTVEG